MNCTHPDHNENETCEDRAVGCHKDCQCCCPKGNAMFIVSEVVFPRVMQSISCNTMEDAVIIASEIALEIDDKQDLETIKKELATSQLYCNGNWSICITELNNAQDYLFKTT